MIHNEEVDKSVDENPRVQMRDVSRVIESEDENDDVGMSTHSLGNPELEKILEQKMMENSGCRIPSGKRVLRKFPGRLMVCLSASLCVFSRVPLDVPR